jgi:membrane protein
MSLKLFGKLLWDAARGWSEDKAPRLGAALAYYSVFSLAPLLLIAMGITGLVFGEQAARGEVLQQLRGLVGELAAAAIEDILANAGQTGGGVLATVVGLVVLLFGASGVFLELQDALNTIWKVMPRPGLGLWEMVRARLISFALVLATGLLLLVLLAVSATLAVLQRYVQSLDGRLPGGPHLWLVVNMAVTFAVLTLLFAALYRLVPDVEIGWRDVWLGGILAAILFTAGKYGLGLYLSHSTLTSAFGAAGSVIILLTWVYYSAQILLYGAEFTRAYARQIGSHIVPSSHAMPASREGLAGQGLHPRPDQHPNADNVPQPSR